ncbi:MAG TPA: DUF4340 domain-containing protein [Syntrophobacteraceae bacterium]|nr:DUF4340 domain-containing protein [Syntrophobacteraceae bacterium]
MKWRSTAVYLLVLLLVSGIYLVMEAKKKEASRKEKQSRRVFVFDAAAVKKIEIRSGEGEEKKVILLEKADNWKISEPVEADVDRALFADFFSSLEDLEQERKIGESAGNPGVFGLDKPSLVVRLLTGGDWLDLHVGDRNPAGTARYARVGQGGDIFMISSATFRALNKNLKDLRRKELFSWQPDQVSEVDVKWRDEKEFSLERQGGARQWKCSATPDLAIKARKVENLLDEVHWLRAVDFAEKNSMPSQALLEVTLKLKDGKISKLKVANPDEAKKEAVADCSEIQGPVLLASHILTSMPRSVVSLADRSLVPADAADIRKITWKSESGGGNLVLMESKGWGTKEGEAPPRTVENSGPVRGFLAFMENAEYDKAVEPGSPGSTPPQGAPDSVQFEDVFGRKSSLTWDRLPAETTGLVSVWMQSDGAPREVRVKYETVKRLNESLARLSEK